MWGLYCTNMRSSVTGTGVGSSLIFLSTLLCLLPFPLPVRLALLFQLVPLDFRGFPRAGQLFDSFLIQQSIVHSLDIFFGPVVHVHVSETGLGESLIWVNNGQIILPCKRKVWFFCNRDLVMEVGGNF